MIFVIGCIRSCRFGKMATFVAASDNNFINMTFPLILAFSTL